MEPTDEGRFLPNVYARQFYSSRPSHHTYAYTPMVVSLGELDHLKHWHRYIIISK